MWNRKIATGRYITTGVRSPDRRNEVFLRNDRKLLVAEKAERDYWERNVLEADEDDKKGIGAVMGGKVLELESERLVKSGRNDILEIVRQINDGKNTVDGLTKLGLNKDLVTQTLIAMKLLNAEQ